MQNKANKTKDFFVNFRMPYPEHITLFIIRPPLDYGDIILDKEYSTSFHQIIGPVEYTALAITGTVKEISREKLY